MIRLEALLGAAGTAINPDDVLNLAKIDKPLGLFHCFGTYRTPQGETLTVDSTILAQTRQSALLEFEAEQDDELEGCTKVRTWAVRGAD